MKNLIRITASLTSSALLSVAAHSVEAQQFQPLDNIQEQVAPAYIPTRCGGLYQAFMEWGGEARLGSDLWRQSDEIRGNFILVAVLMAQEDQGRSTEDVANSVVRDVRNIADIYLERFERNYAVTGQAMAEDTLIVSDLQYCRLTADLLIQ